MGSLTISRLSKAFGDVRVLRDVNLDIEDGEFIALVGPSGCGKSTLLKMIAGLESVTGGEIRIGGELINDRLPKDRNIAMVFQNYALYPHMDARANMEFALKIAHVPVAERDNRVGAASAILGLGHLLERLPGQLSGGQRQRVAMGRAIVRDPKVFLFDEPLSNLDAKLRGSMRAEIKKLHRRLRATTVFVTHDQIEAMTMADRIVVMNGGEIEQVGGPLEVYDDPASLFVASFIGSPGINVIEGTVTDVHGAALVLNGGQRIALGVVPAAAAGRRVSCGIRPEHIELGVNGIPCEVVLVEPMGAQTVTTVRVGDVEICSISSVRSSIGFGDATSLQVLPERAYFFDHASGARIR